MSTLLTPTEYARMLTAAEKREAGRMPDRSWRDLALCAQVDPELFFPGVGESPAPARRICASCEVAAECLENALATPGGDSVGVRAGTTPRQRRALRSSRRAQRVGAGS